MTPYANLTPQQQADIDAAIQHIREKWKILSISSVFPTALHPGPQPQEWGIELLSAINDLANRSLSSMAGAIDCVVLRVVWRNQGLSRMEGDWVIRAEDVRGVVRKGEWKVHKTDWPGEYRPELDFAAMRRERRARASSIALPVASSTTLRGDEYVCGDEAVNRYRPDYTSTRRPLSREESRSFAENPPPYREAMEDIKYAYNAPDPNHEQLALSRPLNDCDPCLPTPPSYESRRPNPNLNPKREIAQRPNTNREVAHRPNTHPANANPQNQQQDRPQPQPQVPQPPNVEHAVHPQHQPIIASFHNCNVHDLHINTYNDLYTYRFRRDGEETQGHAPQEWQNRLMLNATNTNIQNMTVNYHNRTFEEVNRQREEGGMNGGGYVRRG